MNVANNILTLIHASYYLFHSPFRIRQQEKTPPVYTVVSSAFRKVVYVVLCLIGNVFLRAPTVWAQFHILHSNTSDPQLYFSFLSVVFSQIYEISLQRILWSGQRDVIDILNFFETKSHFLPRERLPLIYTKLFYPFMSACFCVGALYQYIFLEILSLSFYNGSVQFRWSGRFLSAYVQFQSCWTLDPNLTTVPVTIEEPTNFILTIFLVLGQFNKTITEFLADFYQFTIVLTVWSLAFTFSKSLKLDVKLNTTPDFTETTENRLSSEPEKLSRYIFPSPLVFHFSSPSAVLINVPPQKLSWKEVHSTYYTIKEATERFNHLCGSLLTWFLGGTILYLSIALDTIIVWGGLRPLIFTSMALFTLILAADVVYQISYLRNWMLLPENGLEISEMEYNMVMHDLTSTAVGIRGSDIFVLSYSLLWSALTTVVTYFIICLQARYGSFNWTSR